jgi:hypothetical protein
MRTVDRLRHFVRILVGRSRVDRDLRDELAHWTDELTARHLARGVPPETAHRLARADVGAVDALKQQVLDEHPAAAFRGSATDLRHAWRGLRRSPMFTAAVVVTRLASAPVRRFSPSSTRCCLRRSRIATLLASSSSGRT